ncbi:hypothetical protein INR49_020164 [Caranx melampygus]|nr:hypothetical protein INR49_020164 [Caranx melampygus]
MSPGDTLSRSTPPPSPGPVSRTVLRLCWQMEVPEHTMHLDTEAESINVGGLALWSTSSRRLSTSELGGDAESAPGSNPTSSATESFNVSTGAATSYILDPFLSSTLHHTTEW